MHSPRLTYLPLRLHLEAKTPLNLPQWPASTLRGAIGRALRPVCCLTDAPTCEGCPAFAPCPYALLFEDPPKAAMAHLPACFATPQRPLVLRVSTAGAPAKLAPGDRFTVELTLFGRARALSALLIQATRQAAATGLGAQGGRARLTRAEHAEDGEPLFVDGPADEPQGFMAFDHPPSIAALIPSPPPKRLGLHLLTPLALRSGTQLCERFEPQVFTARLLDRLKLLAVHAEGLCADWTLDPLLEDAAQVQVLADHTRLLSFERYSARQGERRTMSGLVGTVELAGLTPALYGLFRLAPRLHVGRSTAFGMGALALDPLP